MGPVRSQTNTDALYEEVFDFLESEVGLEPFTEEGKLTNIQKNILSLAMDDALELLEAKKPMSLTEKAKK